MLMADTLAVFFVVLGLLLAHLGVWLLCRGLWPSVTAKVEGGGVGVGLSALSGLPPTVLAIVAAAVFGHVLGGFGKACAAVILAGFFLYAHVGLAGLVARVGRALGPDGETAWRATLKGGLALSLAYLFPLLGWFVLLPISLVIGAGATTIALARKLGERAVTPTLTHAPAPTLTLTPTPTLTLTPTHTPTHTPVPAAT
jgi:hypothetical protein